MKITIKNTHIALEKVREVHRQEFAECMHNMRQTGLLLDKNSLDSKFTEKELDELRDCYDAFRDCAKVHMEIVNRVTDALNAMIFDEEAEKWEHIEYDL